MNYEDAEVVLYATEIMYGANLMITDAASAEATKQSSIENLIRTWLSVNPELDPILPITELAKFRPCGSCEIEKPLFLFKEDADHNFSTRCMDCEAADKYRNEFKNRELPRRLVTKEMTWRVIEEIRAQQGTRAVFGLEELATVVGGKLGVPNASVFNNLRYHVLRFRKAGALRTCGNAEPSGVGRPRALYCVNEQSVRGLTKEERR